MASTPTERVVFEQTIEGLFVRGLKNDVTPVLKKKLLDAGLNLDKLQPGYTFEDWCRFVHIAALEVYPQLGTADAYKKLGERTIAGYFDTFIGKALQGVVKLIGPKRALMRTRQNFRSGNNYTDVQITELGPSTYDLWMNEAGDIRFLTWGILDAGLKITAAEAIGVDVVKFDDQGATYRISWKEK